MQIVCNLVHVAATYGKHAPTEKKNARRALLIGKHSLMSYTNLLSLAGSWGRGYVTERQEKVGLA